MTAEIIIFTGLGILAIIVGIIFINSGKFSCHFHSDFPPVLMKIHLHEI
ncbi:MAG: hypothetical protein ACTSVZ_00725 [Promethearchaeota archaeon]